MSSLSVPSSVSFKSESEKHANLIIQDYFSSDVFKKSKYGELKAKVITTIAMFAGAIILAFYALTNDFFFS